MISFFIPCQPPKATGNNTKRVGINRYTGKAQFFDGNKGRSVKGVMLELLRPFAPKEPLKGPLAMGVTFIFPLNNADTSSKAKRAYIETGGHLWHDTKPDLDNLRKILNDTMQLLGFFENDSQIVIDHGKKLRGKKTGIGIYLEEIIHPPLPPACLTR